MKFCSQCGNQIQDDAAFCNSCGAPQASEQQLGTPNQPQQQFHQTNQQYQHRQPTYRQPNYQPPQKVYRGPNPVEQAVVNFADRYCSPHSLGWSLGLCIAALILNILWDGEYLNFRGTLLDISESIRDYIPLWLMIDIIQLSILYLFMHLVNGLYKAGATWPLLYITPCIWIIVLILLTVLSLTDTGSYDDVKTLDMLQLAYYVCVGIIGILCGSIQSFSWTGKVLIIAVICWLVSMFASNSVIPSIFFVLGTLWYAFEINSRVRHFFNEYYYSINEGYNENTDETQYIQ